MITAIYIENERLDLFEDENIVVNSSVLDIQDITKNTTEYSNSFTVPASNANNIIFKHYYNADIDNAFDARTKVTARIEISGKLFREGKISLQKVIVKKGIASSYMLTFFGRLVSLKDTFGSDRLSDLDLSAFDEDYEPTLIKNLLTNNHTNTDLICSLLSNRKYFYASNSDAYDTTIEGNLWYDAAETDNGIYWKELKPSFLLRTIIEQIETDYSLNFTGAFFDSTMFDNIYIYLDNGSDAIYLSNIENVIFDVVGTETYVRSSGASLPVTATDTYTCEVTITPTSEYLDTEYTLKAFNTGVLIDEITGTGILSILSSITTFGSNDLTYTLTSDKYIAFVPDIEVIQLVSGVPGVIETATKTPALISKPTYLVSSNMPDLTILDFLKGLIQLFKLVVIPTSDTDIYINNVNTYYTAGSLIDLSKYINTNQVEVLKPELLNKIMYAFQDPTTILNKQFKGTTEEGYGDEQLYIYDASANLIDGSSSEIKTPFEQVVYERLTDTQDSTPTNIQYGAIIDTNLEAINIKPHIHYAVLRSIGTKTMAFNDDGTISELSASYWSPSHIADDAAFGTALIFGSELDEYSKTTITVNLYTAYYSDYISGLFNIKRRNHIVTASDIPITTISDIRLNDVIKIGINYYRIDKMNININTGEIKFNLFNILELDI